MHHTSRSVSSVKILTVATNGVTRSGGPAGVDGDLTKKKNRSPVNRRNELIGQRSNLLEEEKGDLFEGIEYGTKRPNS